AEAGRVIAGTARGIRLVAPGEGTRPLADRVKETLFAILEPELRGARFLDLFAGSGAAGIEALSRGADAAVFVEKDATATRTIDENLRRARLGGGQVVRADVLRWLGGAAAPASPFDVVFADPPYSDPQLLLRALEILGDPERAVVAPGARVVAKHFWREHPPAAIGLLASDRERRFGETTLTFYRLVDAAASQHDEEAR
ncbi:MAG: 16S rRNA (guanine(966)-N(2))-methyltransferase RsmD, partial [Chloroflexota bacterium]